MPSNLKLSLRHTLPNHPEIIYNALLDFKKFGELHPNMTDVRILKDNSPEYIAYNIVEEIYLLGFIKNHPRYTAKVMELIKDKHIRYTSQVKKNIFLSIDFTFSKNSNGSIIVNEDIALQSNKLVGRVFLNILKKAHLKFFEKLKDLLHTSIEDVIQKD